MHLRASAAALALGCFVISVQAATPEEIELDKQFTAVVRPFLDANCTSCHSGEKPKSQFDVQPYTSLLTVQKDHGHWLLMREKLAEKLMPPPESKTQPTDEARKRIIEWIDAVRQNDARKNAGDPGLVLARRLSNAEYDNTVRDLIGVDLQPTREFPVDPANQAGFDNSGESLQMTPALIKKYLQTARDIANHLYLKQQGIGFAEREMLSETDRDKFCEWQIVSLYQSQNTNYADYFVAAWTFKHRAALGTPNVTLAEVAARSKVSPKYLATIWTLLEETQEDVGPVARLHGMWKGLPAPVQGQPDIARQGAEEMRDWIWALRRKIEPRFAGLQGRGGQALPIWLNTQYATNRMTFDAKQLQVEGEAQPEPPAPATLPATQPGARGRGAARGGRGGRGGQITNAPGDPDLLVPAGQRARYEASFAKFCAVFPDRFYTQQRGTNYFNEGNETGRYLSAGFLNRMGYFRDDIPLYELILDKQQQETLDSMWRDMDYLANVTRRTYLQSFDVGSGQARALLGEGVNAAPDDALASPEIIKKYADGMTNGSNNEVVSKVVQDYYQGVNDRIRWAEKTRIDSEPSHLAGLADFASRAYRRPLTQAERDDLLAFYKTSREQAKLDHESAMRDAVVYVLMSPDFMYRVDLVQAESGVHPLSDYDLASRLSYFLWASKPDEELLSRAAAKDLHDPKVIAQQAKRMLRDARARGMVVEFGTNMLEIRRFEDINTVDRGRFPAFTDELRDAMFEEPIRFMLNVVQNNRSILDLIYANDTYVNPVLAKHYGMPEVTGGANNWVHIDDASKYNRGGLLPMGAFLTKNAPGQRTSPVKRGNWIVKNLLGERIAPPPADVPVLPQDEATTDLPLPQMLAKHREDPNCATCHARFDSLGLVFEGFGPVGERREKDLAGRAVDAHATFPGGSQGEGITGVRQYIKDHRQDDFVRNFVEKSLAYALGRSLMLSDELLIREIEGKLAKDGYRFDIVVESIVTSPQFLNKRGREAVAER